MKKSLLALCFGLVALVGCSNNVKPVIIHKTLAETTYNTIYTDDLTEGIENFALTDNSSNVLTINGWSFSITRSFDNNSMAYDYYLTGNRLGGSIQTSQFYYIYFDFETLNFNYDNTQPNAFIVYTSFEKTILSGRKDLYFTDFKDVVGDTLEIKNSADSLGSNYDYATYEYHNSSDFDLPYKNRLYLGGSGSLTSNNYTSVSLFLFSLKISYYYGNTTNQNYFSNDNTDSYTIGYNKGYQYGLEQGKANGKEETINTDYQGKTYQQIYNTGYNVGWQEGNDSNSYVPQLFEGIVNIPISTLNGLMPLSFFDVSIIRVVITILAFSVVLWLISYLMSAKG